MSRPVRLSLLDANDDLERLAALMAPEYFGDETAPRETLAQNRRFLLAHPRPQPWGSYLAWSGERLVGICAYKSAPDAGGAVEIAYSTLPAFEGRGHAKAMIAALYERAVEAGARTVFALTLPQQNASNRALVAEGFAFAGEVDDPEDGLVWRWEKPA